MEHMSQLPTAWGRSLERMPLGIGGGLSRAVQSLAEISTIFCGHQEPEKKNIYIIYILYILYNSYA